MASLLELLRLLDDEAADERQPQPRRRNRRAAARRQNPPKDTFSNSGTQNMEGLINNAGYVEGNGNGAIIYGGFDSSTKTYN
ncbi:unnamed protein product [Lathyrus sativus]|nr:unnamed protein product [Lathyrus sativus]